MILRVLGAVDVADGCGERVGGIVRRRGGAQAEQQLHHLLHLVLVGAAVADDGALDLGGRVFRDRDARGDGRDHRDAARVSELQRAADVRGVEQVLDGDAVGPALGEQPAQFDVNGREDAQGRTCAPGC